MRRRSSLRIPHCGGRERSRAPGGAHEAEVSDACRRDPWSQLDPDFAAGKQALVAEDWNGAIAALKLAALRKSLFRQHRSKCDIAVCPSMRFAVEASDDGAAQAGPRSVIADYRGGCGFDQLSTMGRTPVGASSFVRG